MGLGHGCRVSSEVGRGTQRASILFCRPVSAETGPSLGGADYQGLSRGGFTKAAIHAWITSGKWVGGRGRPEPVLVHVHAYIGLAVRLRSGSFGGSFPTYALSGLCSLQIAAIWIAPASVASPWEHPAVSLPIDRVIPDVNGDGPYPRESAAIWSSLSG
jgi:hypothetical protein